jgi:hypothetical protein
MAVQQRFRSGGARGVARFLADHQHCNAGFDVRRDDDPGSGRLSITCEGCGETIEYRAGDAGAPSALDQVLVDQPNGSTITGEPGGRVPPEPAAGPQASEAGPPISPPPGAPRAAHGRLPRWLAPALIGGLILAGCAMIAIGLMTSDGEEGAPEPVATEAPVPEPEAPAPAPADPAPAPAEPAPEPAPQAALRTRSFAAGQFSIGLPAGWKSGGSAAEGFNFEAPGDAAAVTVFFEQGGRPAGQLATLARDFLAQRHPDAQIGPPKPTRLANSRALRVIATYDGGTESAVAFSNGGFAYLVLERVDAGASPEVSADADAVLASFKPR